MKDKWITISIIVTGLICAIIGAGVQYTFDNIEIKYQKDLLKQYEDWLDYYFAKYPLNNSFLIFNLPCNNTLKNSDFDGDGITDFAEFYIYYTNPFKKENGFTIDKNTNFTIENVTFVDVKEWI